MAGAVWWGVAAGAVVRGTPATVAWVLVGVLVGGAVLLVARRRLSSAGAHEAMAAHRGSFGLVNLAQVAGFLAVVALCRWLGAPQLVVVGVTAVFAVHFLPFARLFSWRGYTLLACALLGVSAAGGLLAAAGASAGGVHALVGPGVATVLWATVLLAAREHRPVGDRAVDDRAVDDRAVADPAVVTGTA